MWRWVIYLFQGSCTRVWISTGRVKPVIFLGATALLMSFSVNGFGAMPASDIAIIQEAIGDSGATWIAGENDMTRLGDAERASMLGALPELGSPPDNRSRERASLSAAPPYFSWGDNGGSNWMTSVKNQGQCGSCWSFAVCGAFEARDRIRLNLPWMPVDLSEQNMVSCWWGSCDGWYASEALDYLSVLGCPGESCFPYSSGSGSVPSCDDRCSDWYQCPYFVGDHGWWYEPSVETMKDEIMANGPVPSYMVVYEDFYAYNGGVYEYTSGGEEGGHLIILYGWDDANNCWLAKNSWGTGWGEYGPDGTRGWFRIRMGTNEVLCEHNVYYLDPTITIDTDSDGICDGGDTDDDNDGVADATDINQLDPSICADADADGCDDCAVGTDGFGPLPDNLPNNDGTDTDADGICDAGDNCPDDPNPGQEDIDGNDIGDVCDGCCVGRVGDVNGAGGDEPTIGDISDMIDAKFITGACLVDEGLPTENRIIECLTEADINQSGGINATCVDITIGDISDLINYLFIGGPSVVVLPDCL